MVEDNRTDEALPGILGLGLLASVADTAAPFNHAQSFNARLRGGQSSIKGHQFGIRFYDFHLIFLTFQNFLHEIPLR